MKFRALMQKEAVLMIHSITSTLERIGSTAVIFLNQECIRIAVSTDSADVPKCYSELDPNTLFPDDYRIESQSGNTILFEIGLDHLTRALASGKNATQSQIKLVKRGQTPCLCFEAKDPDSLAVDIIHDIPIKVLKPSDIIYFMPPDVPPPMVALELPRNNKLMRVIIDKMSKISKNVHLSASQTGRIIFRAEHSTATIKTFYNGLQTKFLGDLDENNDRENKAAVKLDIRKLSVVLNHSSLPVHTASLYITDNAALVVQVDLEPPGIGGVTFYIPVILFDIEED